MLALALSSTLSLPRLSRVDDALAVLEESLVEKQSFPSEARKAAAWAADLLDMEKYETEEDAWKGLFAEQTAPDYDWLHAKFRGVIFHKKHGMPEMHAALADLEAEHALPAEMRDVQRVESILLKEMSSFYHNNAAALEDAVTHKKALRQRLTDALTSGISEQRKTARALERKHAGKHAVARALPRRRHDDGAVLDMERERFFGWIADMIEWVVVKVVEVVEACATAIYNAAKWIVDNFTCILCNLGCLIVTVCVKAAVYGTGVGLAIDVMIKAVLKGFKKLIKDFIKSTGIEAFFQAKCIDMSYVGDWIDTTQGDKKDVLCPKDEDDNYTQQAPDCGWSSPQESDENGWLGRVSNSIADLFGFTYPSMMGCVRSICVAVFQTILDTLTDGPLDAFLGFVTGQVQSFICPDCTTLSNDCHDNLKDQLGNLKGLDFKDDSITPEQIRAKVLKNQNDERRMEWALELVPTARDVIHPCDASVAFTNVPGHFAKCYTDEFVEHHIPDHADCVVRPECKHLEAGDEVDVEEGSTTEVNGEEVTRKYDWSKIHFEGTVDPLKPSKNLPAYCHDPMKRRTGKGCAHQCESDVDCQGMRECDKSSAVNGVGWCRGRSMCCDENANAVANKPTPNEWGQGRDGHAAGLTTKREVNGGDVCRIKAVGKTPKELKNFNAKVDPQTSTPEEYERFFCLECPVPQGCAKDVHQGDQWCPEGDDQKDVYNLVYTNLIMGGASFSGRFQIECPGSDDDGGMDHMGEHMFRERMADKMNRGSTGYPGEGDHGW